MHEDKKNQKKFLFVVINHFYEGHVVSMENNNMMNSRSVYLMLHIDVWNYGE
jgi:hypothetical protein